MEDNLEEHLTHNQVKYEEFLQSIRGKIFVVKGIPAHQREEVLEQVRLVTVRVTDRAEEVQ